MVIVGNKCDEDGREVNKEEAQALAKQLKVKLIETSAKQRVSSTRHGDPSYPIRATQRCLLSRRP